MTAASAAQRRSGRWLWSWRARRKMGEGGGGVVAKRKVRVLAIAAAAVLAAALPALAGRLPGTRSVPSPFYTLTCDTTGLPQAYVGPYVAAVRRAVDRWNHASPQ